MFSKVPMPSFVQPIKVSVLMNKSNKYSYENMFNLLCECKTLIELRSFEEAFHKAEESIDPDVYEEITLDIELKRELLK